MNKESTGGTWMTWHFKFEKFFNCKEIFLNFSCLLTQLLLFPSGILFYKSHDDTWDNIQDVFIVMWNARSVSNGSDPRFADVLKETRIGEAHNLVHGFCFGVFTFLKILFLSFLKKKKLRIFFLIGKKISSGFVLSS